MHLLNADLHSHSLHSDGTLSPRALAARAKAQGVELWALTDHDVLAGQAEAAEAAHALGLGWVSGVEISVSFAGESVHVVGLGFDPADPVLNAGLSEVRGGRARRARAMASELARVGIEGGYEGALRHAGSADQITRTHFARWLVEQGVCADAGAVFRRFLTPGKPGFIEHQWAGLGDAVRWITQAGGIAVIAHPARYRFSAIEEYALFSEFKAHGGGAVEVLTGSQNGPEARRYGELADEFDLFASRGSDFHSPGESRVELGALPDLPGSTRPVWQALADAMRRAA